MGCLFSLLALYIHITNTFPCTSFKMSLPRVWLIFSFSYIYFKMEQKDYIWKMPVFNMTPFCPAFWCHLPALSQRRCPSSWRADSSHFVRPSRVFIVTTRFITALCRLHLILWQVFERMDSKRLLYCVGIFASLKVSSHSCHTTKTNLLMSPENLLHVDSRSISRS